MYDIILCNRNHSIRSDVSGDAMARSDSELSRHTLYIIGNGFDLANGVRSSYRDFAKFLKKQGRDGHYLYDTMEFYLGSAPDLWGDFEASLAYLDRGKAMDSVDIIQGDLLDVKDPEDENFSAAEYFATIEMGLANLTNIQEMLPELFFKWVKTLDSDKPVWKCPVKLDYDGRYINFNYTEFLETRYGVPNSNILYIHGNRNKGKKNIILGHGDDSYEAYLRWKKSIEDDPYYQPYIEENGKTIRNTHLSAQVYGDFNVKNNEWKNPARFYSVDVASEMIDWYFESTMKKCDDIIKKNIGYFESLHDIKRICVIGHSLSLVDRPYFKKLIEINDNPDSLVWEIGYYNDMNRAEEFVCDMGINPEKVKYFSTRTRN